MGKALAARDGTNGAQTEVNFDSDRVIAARSDVTITAAGTSSFTLGQKMTFSNFYGDHSVYVTSWYDQSGRGINVTQNVEANQPRIVTAGTIESVRDIPGIRGIASSRTYMKMAANNVTIGTINYVAQFFSSTAPWSGIYSFRSAGSKHTPNTTTTSFGAQIGPSYTMISSHLNTTKAAWVNGTAPKDLGNFNNYRQGIFYVDNGILTQYVAVKTGHLNGVFFEDNCCGNRSLDGTIQEVIFFPVQLSTADRHARTAQHANLSDWILGQPLLPAGYRLFDSDPRGIHHWWGS